MRGENGIPFNILDDISLSHQELLSYAGDLALTQKVATRRLDYAQLRLGEAGRNIENAYMAARQSKYSGREMPAISEWFYDNRFLFIEQLKQIELGKAAQKLPHIVSGRFAHYPRSFALAAELARYSAFSLSMAGIEEFLQAYQKESGLNSGELWVFVDMLKVALLTAVSALALRSVECVKARARAQRFCTRLSQQPLAAALTEFKNELTKPLFVEHVMALLREHPNGALVAEAIGEAISPADLTVDKLVKQAHSAQARNLLHIANAVSSLRMLAKVNFEIIFENVSAVHRCLCEDETYPRMDFDSREYYRRRVTDIAALLRASEPAVARMAVRLSAAAGEHVGVYLTGEKREELMRAMGGPPPRARLEAFFRRHMLLFYAGGAGVSSIISSALLCLPLFLERRWAAGIIGFFISLIPVYSVAITINNRMLALLTKPAFLPKLELKEGIPEDCASMVVVPALVLGADDGRELLEKMEVYYAANQQPNLYFTLLSDFKEASAEAAPGDEETTARIAEVVAELNARQPQPVFFYAQRRRTPLPEGGRFGGWERKRGALLSFCALLRGDGAAFAHVTPGIPQNIKYVITLDADTELQRDAAVRMVGAMVHPLHRPQVDEATRTVKRGHALMQPRIGIDVVSAAQTRFSLVSSGKAGLDTYSGAASDVYQDNFGTGIYTGKGIFDLDVYVRVLTDTFPDNRILSHDLLEGSYLRCALLSDVVLMDGYPAKYLSWAKRQHRWVRGDWQLLPWLRHTVHTRQGTAKNPLSRLARFQILDNLRRSLTPPLCFVVILLSQTAFYHSALFWFISGILPLFIDGIVDFALRLWTLLRNTGKGVTVRDVWLETRTAFEQAFYKLAFLPYETYLMLDAAVRTIVRLFTKKHMLEWVTAAEGERGAREGNAQYWRRMKAAPLLAAILYALSIAATKHFSLLAFVVFGVWFFAPSIAYALSRPRVRRKSSLDAKQRAYLEDAALKTWRFFEHFSEEKEYYWTPDNYQQSPKKGVAKRTSPTNIAFSMAATVSAYYFGFLTPSDALERIDKCLSGIERAEKWKGHLYNWYDITTLAPLEPRYISSVDSGNLACYLIVAEAAVQEFISRPMAASLQQGLPAISREAQREVSLCIGDDIFNAVYALGLIEDTGDALSAHCGRLRAFLAAYAGWAGVLCAFPSGLVNRYSGLTQALRDALRSISVAEYGQRYHEVLELLPPIMESASAAGDAEALDWVRRMERALSESYIACRRLSQRAARLCRRLRTAFSAMDFAALYDEEKGLFSIGFDVRAGLLSGTHYDLLASEARQTSFIAIAKGDVPGKHWFRLARPLALAGDERVLLSWGGTMFEYFMPLLLMRSYDHTLMSETYRSALALQQAYTEARSIPWGVSESGYYAFDLQMNYQYKAFGVPSLGMKSGLVRETVVTPYAAALALPVDPAAALADLLRFEKLGALGRYGFFEAVDYTPRRMHKGKKKRIVKSYMAHHQGMILSSILNALQEGRLQALFHSATIVKATEMLLKEKVPPRNIVLSLAEKQPDEQPFAEEIRAARTFTHLQGFPEAHFLSNGSYTTMVTQQGAGYSAWHGKLLTRFMGDCLRDAPGVHVWLRSAEGHVWSAALLPACVRADRDKVTFEPHKATFERAVDGIETVLEVCVSPECDMEVRILEIRNTGDKPAALTVCGALDPALCPQRDFEAHPAFAELFVDAEADASRGTVYARRRGGAMHCGLKVCGGADVTLMTDRAAIFGREAFGMPAWAQPHARGDVARALGAKCGVVVPPGEARTVVFAVAAAEARQPVAECLASVSGEEDARRISHLAWTHAQVEMRFLKLKDMQATLFQRIASRVVLPAPSGAAPGAQMPVDALWKLGFSGDDPLICLNAHDASNTDAIRTMGKAMEYLRLKGVTAQLAVVYDGGEQYLCPLRERAAEAVQSAPDGRIRAISRAHASAEDIAAIEAAACLVLDDEMPFAEQLKTNIATPPQRVFSRTEAMSPAKLPRRIKLFDNGIGGYWMRGTEYCIDVPPGGTPRPWCNVLANVSFGSVVSASGGGYTWAGNARTDRLTPFRNDALRDIPAEGVLVRSDTTGEAFGTASGVCASGAYRTTHGFGYTIFERHGGVITEAISFADARLPVKVTLLSLENHTGREDEFSVYYFAEPAPGDVRCGGFSSEYADGVLRARPAFGPGRGMYIAMPGLEAAHTNCAFEFFGAPGEHLTPQALKAETLSGRDGGGATLLALQTHIRLKPGERRELVLLLGSAEGAQDALQRYAGAQEARAGLEEAKTYWEGLTGAIRVSTREKSLDTLVNGWLQYQAYASRLFARSGYYQSGGAYGFRDQLQDMLALLFTEPQRMRAHLLRCAERQFMEGDVLHWWHEPTLGVRTRITDDKLFLVYAACEYERVTGDMSVFEETARYLESRCIPDGQCDIYERFRVSEASEPLFNHCVRALDSALVFGEHGLPLMGGGDWNDGMNRVGEAGKGESVWLAFFLAETLHGFAALCRTRGEEALAERYTEQRVALMRSVEACAWDGEWYLRAFFDDGTPLGSSASPECRIDIVSQAWAAIAGAPRARHAFDAAMERLVLPEEGIIRLLWPSFDSWEKDPGYIRNYLPGVRENGGQYTHAAVWFVIAAAKLGRRDDALALLRMLNPINHTRTRADAERYRGEPYVMAADVYDTPGAQGRAGWTWYTGAAGWLYQAAVAHVLGMRIERGALSIQPCVPDDFGRYTLEYRRGGAHYTITVDVQPGYQGEAWLSLDGGAPTHSLPLDAPDGEHQISACWTLPGDDILGA